MNLRRFSRVIALSVATAILLPAVAEAQVLRFYDPVTNSFVTYKSDRNQRRSETPDPQFQRQVVEFPTAEQPGTVIIDSQNKFLYYVLPDQMAVRYGVGVGREGFGWSGTVRVGAMAGMADLDAAGGDDRAPAGARDIRRDRHGRRPRQPARRARHVSLRRRPRHDVSASTGPTSPGRSARTSPPAASAC